jgi:hypothetical protein
MLPNAQPKPEPRIVAKMNRRRLKTRMDVKEKNAVRKRDREACRVCFRRSREVHERLMKSRGGVASSENSMVLCKKCHAYAHAHGFKVFGTTCDRPLRFQMCAAVAHDIFRGAAVPSHVDVLPEGR